MKVTTINSNFSGIKTVVYYKWSSFIPTDVERLSNKHESELILNHTSKDVYYYSEKDASDLLSFSEYSFKERPEKDKFKSFVFANYLDSSTLSLLKTGKDEFNYELLTILSKKIFPQKSTEELNNSSSEHKFFGVISDLSQNILYLDVPENVWKIELYDEYIFSNYKYGNFVDSELLDKLFSTDLYKNRILKKPSLVITLGPEANHLNNLGLELEEGHLDFSMYFKESLDFYSELSDDLTGFIKINETDWDSLYKEIISRKILKLVTSSNDSFGKSVNLSSISWGKDINPNRNKNRIALRNDDFWASRDNNKLLSSIDDGNKVNGQNLLIDSNSGVILGTKKIINSNQLFPIFNSKKRPDNKVYHSRKVYNVGDIVLLNDYLYISLVSGNIGENPKYSSFWKILKRYDPKEDDSLSNYEYSLTLLRESLITDYYQLYTHSNNKNFGEISPMGHNSLKKSSESLVYITPYPGYQLNNIEVYIDGQRVYGELPDYDITYQRYYYKIPTIDFKLDIKRSIEVKAVFSERAKAIRPHSINIIGEDYYGSWGNSRNFGCLKFIDYTEKTKIPGNGSSGFSLIVKDSLGNILTTSNEIEDITSEDGKERIELPNSEMNYPIEISINDSFSPYKIVSSKSIDSNGDIFSLKKNNNGQYLLQEKQSYDLIIEVESKRLDCRILSNNGVDVSTYGSYVIFGKDFSFSFAMVNSSSKFKNIIIKFEDDELEVNQIDKNYLLSGRNGLTSTVKLSVTSKNIYTLVITNVTVDLIFSVNSDLN